MAYYKLRILIPLTYYLLLHDMHTTVFVSVLDITLETTNAVFTTAGSSGYADWILCDGNNPVQNNCVVVKDPSKFKPRALSLS